ncbi:MAG: hypothetical protein SFW36_19490 [Leptolyngbyaceae cyanobacterium bins.59]|nr:hypothetical protein [Leptolyngbyaceae cyanobacterium bins.59]
MASIDELILQEANPFDPVTFKVGNFWQEDRAVTPTVNSIHQEAIVKLNGLLDQVARDHKTRAVLLAGDPGSGKSFVLKRLQQSFNSKAFFVYIPPCVNSDYMWRHTLRHTVDSLMQKPEGQEESQLILWLKSLSVFKDRSILQKLLGERRLFIDRFKKTYPTGIYQANDFFGLLYDLTQSDLYFSVCNWLRGDDLDEEELKVLRLRKSIDSEANAQGILSNLGRISTSTYPIVLCFDQVETTQLPNGSANIAPVFNVNTIFHNENFKNFLIIISINISTWQQNKTQIQQSDKDRIEDSVVLKRINLDQAEALWQLRLDSLHALANPKPESNIFPLTRAILEKNFPGGKTTPRHALILGQNIFQTYKLSIIVPPPGPDPEPDPSPSPLFDSIASFRLLWEQEFERTSQKVDRIRYFSAPDLISMLSRVLSALQIQTVQPKLLPSPTYSSYSFSFQDPKSARKIGLVWTEEPNMTSFFHVMEACRKAVERSLAQSFYLIRAEGTGKKNTKGNILFNQIFVEAEKNRHIKADLESVHYLATYDRMVNSANSQELVIAENTITLPELEALIRDSGVLKECRILQDLDIFPKSRELDLTREKEFFFSFIKTQHLISRKVVVENTKSQFPNLTEPQILQIIQELSQEGSISILDPTAPLEAQILCFIPPVKVA